MLNAIEIFKNSIQSPTTLEMYTKRLEEFHKFTKIKTYDSYLRMDHKVIENLIMEYVSYLKKKIEKGIITPNAMQQRISPIELFMSQNDIMINAKKIHRTYPRKVKAKGELPYTLEDIQSMLENSPKIRDRFLITFFASTAVRPGATIGLKYRHLEEMDQDCMAVTIYEDDVEEYLVFLTPECVKYLQKYFKERESYGEKITPETPLFRLTFSKYRDGNIDVRPMTYNAQKQAMYDIVKRAKLRKPLVDRGMKHEKAMFGGFRKYFNRTLKMRKDANLSLCEKLMGHSTTIPLDNHYLPAQKQDVFSEFQKVIPELTIDDKQRLQRRNEAQKLKITALEMSDRAREKLKDDVEILKLEVERMRLSKE